MTERGGNLSRGEHGQRHLVQQRLERVMILAVDERDFERLAGQCLRRLQTAESAADDDDLFVHILNLNFVNQLRADWLVFGSTALDRIRAVSRER